MKYFKRETTPRHFSRWGAPGGYAHLLKLAIPLILSTSALAIQHFVDRMFLTWYSPESIAASMPSGMMNFAFLSLFIGTASYVNTFVAQYFGAGMYNKIGKSVWHGIYFSFIGFFAMFLLIPFVKPLFGLAGHLPEIQVLEAQYFTILCVGGFFPVVTAALSGFFSGIGQTWTVMWVNVVATAVNIVLDYFLIFGTFGFPEMGISGAAVATVIATFVSFALFFSLFLKREYRLKYATWSGKLFEYKFFKRLIFFGLPNGIQFFLDMLGFSMFVLLVGRYGKIELAATNIAFNINMLAFLPMIGVSIAVSVMVGQCLGNKDPEQAEYSTWSAAHLTFLYMTIIAGCYLFFPAFFLMPFGYKGYEESFREIFEHGVVLLRFIALYSIFDTMNLVFSAAIKGAGDTKFVMKAVVLLSWGVMVLPTYFAVTIFHWSLYSAWFFLTAYVVILGFVFLFRFLDGKWKHMSIIEEHPEPIPTVCSENPVY